jgi:hypothetical protein
VLALRLLLPNSKQIEKGVSVIMFMSNEQIESQAQELAGLKSSTPP